MIFTFYSYKGGVGRSMAMAGVAHLLARRGLKVLAIDFDLEAPGLERYFFEGEAARSVRLQPGLIDLIRAYRLALTSESAFEKAEFKRWDRFKVTAVFDAGTLGGSVDLMTAGQREPEEKLRDYALAVRGFDWQDFFHNWKGDLFFDWLRRQFREPVGGSIGGYDVVLVDSRTGVTEMGGVCAYQLADVAVLLCAPNYQNLEGTRDVARDFRSDGVLGLRQGRPLEILAVPARVEADHPKREEFLLAFARELGVDGMPKALAEAGLTYANLALPYMKEFAIVERLVDDRAVTQDGSEAPPIDVFERLADALTLLAEPGSKLARQRDAALDRLRGIHVDKPAELVADTTRSSAGYDLFLDYSPADVDMARQIDAALEAAGCNTFMDIADGGANAAPGADAQRAIDQALDYSHALLVCFGRPTDTEMRARLIARARRHERVDIIPVLLPGADPGALASFDLSVSQAVDLSGWPDRNALDRLLARVGASGRHPSARAPQAAERDPYPGAKPYSEDDAGYFFGREHESRRLRDALATHDVVLLSGAAQIGKTSLLKAGLMPCLRPGGDWSTEFRLGELAWIDYSESDALSRDRLPDWLREGGGVRLGSEGNATNQPWSSAPPNLVVIDGIDDFSHGGSRAVRSLRFAEIAEMMRAAGEHCKFVLCWRGSLSDDERDGAVAEWRRRSFTEFDLAPLTGQSLLDAIQEPAKRAGHLLEPGLCHRLIESARGAANAIAQIQLALVAIWPERKRGWLTNKMLDNAGHLDGIFERHLKAVVGALGAKEAHGAEVLFKSLVVLDSSFKLVPVAQEWDLLEAVPAIAAADAIALRDRLASAAVVDLRCATHDVDADQDAPPPAFVQLALSRQNPGVYFGGRDAVPDARFLMWRTELAGSVFRWRSTGRGEDALLRGAALQEAQEWLANRVDELTVSERDFIDASIAAREKAEADERERERAERLAFETRQRERADAAEKIAEHERARLETEKKALARAQEDAARLRRGRLWLIGFLVAALASTVFAVMATIDQAKARRAEEEAHRIAEQSKSEAQRSVAELKDLLATQFGWSDQTTKTYEYNYDTHSLKPAQTSVAGDAHTNVDSGALPPKAGISVPGVEQTGAGSLKPGKVETELYAIRESLAANKLIQTAARPDERERRKAVTVEYFPKSADENKIEAALADLGFTVRKSAPRVAGLASNAVWFGSTVSIDDVKLVALTLIRAGVPIKAIRPSELDSKKDLIQIGADTDPYIGKQVPYTVERIQAATSFSDFKPCKAGTWNVIAASLGNDKAAANEQVAKLRSKFPGFGFKLTQTVAGDGASNLRFAVMMGHGLTQEEANALAKRARDAGVARDAFPAQQNWAATCIDVSALD